jgi:hypothetical protein
MSDQDSLLFYDHSLRPRIDIYHLLIMMRRQERQPLIKSTIYLPLIKVNKSLIRHLAWWKDTVPTRISALSRRATIRGAPLEASAFRAARLTMRPVGEWNVNVESAVPSRAPHLHPRR